MNAASQLLRVLAILGAIAAGVLFYLSNGKIAGLKSDLDTANAAAASAKTNADKAGTDAQTQLATDAQSLADMKKQLSAATADEDLANTRYKGAMGDSDAKDAAVTAAKKAASDANGKVADLQTQVDTIPDLQSQITDLKTQLKTATDTITQLQANPGTGTAAPDSGTSGSKPGDTGKPNSTTHTITVSTPMVPKNLSPASPAQILQLDSRNWLLVLDTGTGTGVSEGTVLYLKVGDDNLAIVQVTATSGSHATAAIPRPRISPPTSFSALRSKV